jgi:hypothetical protein
MKNTGNKLNALHTGQILGRSEMKKIMAGSGSGGNCWLVCTNCQNDTCQGNVPNCNPSSEWPVCGFHDSTYDCDCMI